MHRPITEDPWQRKPPLPERPPAHTHTPNRFPADPRSHHDTPPTSSNPGPNRHRPTPPTSSTAPSMSTLVP